MRFFAGAMLFMFEDRMNIATAATPYVADGPKVQYEAHAIQEIKPQALALRDQGGVPSRGPMARPSCPEDRNCPRALPFASCGCSIIGLPVSLSTTSSHCSDANEVNEFTTVADVKARHTAAACRSRMETEM